MFAFQLHNSLFIVSFHFLQHRHLLPQTTNHKWIFLLLEVQLLRYFSDLLSRLLFFTLKLVHLIVQNFNLVPEDLLRFPYGVIFSSSLFIRLLHQFLVLSALLLELRLQLTNFSFERIMYFLSQLIFISDFVSLLDGPYSFINQPFTVFTEHLILHLNWPVTGNWLR